MDTVIILSTEGYEFALWLVEEAKRLYLLERSSRAAERFREAARIFVGISRFEEAAHAYFLSGSSFEEADDIANAIRAFTSSYLSAQRARKWELMARFLCRLVVCLYRQRRYSDAVGVLKREGKYVKYWSLQSQMRYYLNLGLSLQMNESLVEAVFIFQVCIRLAQKAGSATNQRVYMDLLGLLARAHKEKALCLQRLEKKHVYKAHELLCKKWGHLWKDDTSSNVPGKNEVLVQRTHSQTRSSEIEEQLNEMLTRD